MQPFSPFTPPGWHSLDTCQNCSESDKQACRSEGRRIAEPHQVNKHRLACGIETLEGQDRSDYEFVYD